jgi:FAD synthase
MIFFNLEKQKAVIVLGNFNPIHKGHLEYFNNVKSIPEKPFYRQMNEVPIDGDLLIKYNQAVCWLKNCR